MSTLQVDRIIPYQSSSVTVEGLSAPNLATTGSNTFVGNQNIQGTITASIQEGFALVGGVGNVSTLVATSSFGGGGSGFPFTGAAQITGSLGVSGATTIGGELSVTPALLPNGFPAGTGQFIIPFLSGSTNVIARDSDNALYWQPAFNVLAVSSSAGNTTVSNSGMTVTSGTTGSTQVTTTRVVSNFGSGRNIAIAGDAASTALTGLTGITNPAIILQSGSAGLPPTFYAPIQFQASQSFTDGRVTFTRPLIAQQGAQITGSVLVSGSLTQTFTAPSTESEIPLITINGAVVTGTPFNNVRMLVQDYESLGQTYTEAIGFEYWDSLSYLYGSEFTLNGKEISLVVLPTGSAVNAQFRIFDNTFGKPITEWNATEMYIGTSLSRSTDFIRMGNTGMDYIRLTSQKNEITGSVSLSSTLQLAGQDPLPTGAVGQLAVSASNLYYHNGSGWTQIN
jgi:hypothetical protein